jgi:hypothetical protein
MNEINENKWQAAERSRSTHYIYRAYNSTASSSSSEESGAEIDEY